MEDDTLSLKELLSIDLTKVPEQESLQILDNNFPCCYHYCPVKAGKSVFEIVET